MDEREYRDGYHTANPQPCRFEKALLAHCADCSRARRFHLAEREGVACAAAGDRRRCEAWLGLLRVNAAFALHVADPAAALPHGRMLKLQCGGLRGLQALLRPEERAAPVEDVAGLLAAAEAAFDGLDGVPFERVVGAVAAYEPRRRRRR